MKVIFLFLAIVGFHVISGAPMPQRDRDRLMAHHEMTTKWLVDEVSGLTDAQLNFRKAPDKWTIAEVVDHLVIAEPSYWQLFRDAMKQPAQKLDRQPSDADVLWYGIDRTHHEKTPKDKDPQGRVIDIPKALAEFKRMHSSLLEYIRSTDEDLRAHTVPEWNVDAYQCLVEISAHTQRHILQIREVKADTRYPTQ